jgi:hypothetical protein
LILAIARFPVIAGSGEIVATNSVSLCGANLRHGLWSTFSRGDTVTSRFEQCAQDRQWHASVPGFGQLV